MVENIKLSDFKLVSNYLLIKPDSNFDILAIDGPGGKKVELKIITFGEYEANHYSISGTIIKKPSNTFYFDKTIECSQKEFQSCMKASLGVNCDFPFIEGDKIYYNYNVQLNCEEEHRLVETEEHGICMLITFDSVFGVEKNGELLPVNGYVFFKRDVEASEIEFESGLVGIQNVNPYGTHIATVIASSSPVKAYLDGGSEGGEVYNPGDRILIDKRFGYKMAYDLHGGNIKNVEVAFRKHLLAKIEEVAP